MRNSRFPEKWEVAELSLRIPRVPGSELCAAGGALLLTSAGIGRAGLFQLAGQVPPAPRAFLLTSLRAAGTQRKGRFGRGKLPEAVGFGALPPPAPAGSLR